MNATDNTVSETPSIGKAQRKTEARPTNKPKGKPKDTDGATGQAALVAWCDADYALSRGRTPARYRAAADALATIDRLRANRDLSATIDGKTHSLSSWYSQITGDTMSANAIRNKGRTRA